MSNTGIFFVGFFITLVVFVAMGVLAYGIKLEDGDLKVRDQDSEALEASEPGLIPISSIGSREGSELLARRAPSGRSATEGAAVSPPASAA